MCQMLSPERAVIWSALHSADGLRAVRAEVRAEYFTHAPYRHWFELSRRFHDEGRALTAEAFQRALEQAGHAPSLAERRALRRMFRVGPPPRVRANLPLLARALADRHAGRPVHMERLIN